MGLAAAAAANSEAVVEGNIGAGLGATVGKLFGMERAMKSGIGSATVSLTGRWAGVMVSALAAVNAFGDVLDPKTGQVLAGARESATSNKFTGTAEALLRGDGAPPPLSNTTLVVVATNARLSKVEAAKLAQLGQHGMVRTISPVHTAYDGDLIIALSLGDRVVDVNALGVAAGIAVAQAIERGVRLAKPLGGLPGLG
jgi:L-aminopeptidase/D-esterase-like protein